MLRHALLLILCALLLACGQSRIVKREYPGEPRRGAPVQVIDGAYKVRKGDTLYGIAFRHGLDYRDVANWNRIGAPYTIYPGQVLRLQPSTRTAQRPAPPARQPTAPNRPVTTMPAPSKPPAKPSPASPSKPAPAAPAASPVPTVAPGRWQWPTLGQVIARYVAGDPTQQGIAIAGKSGQPVQAAADGVVVYSGTGLVGYGEVIIVKHSDEWLSAYGHNRRRLVAEGEAVKSGQTIAELGRSGTSRDMLHFEIRRNGKPVDPLTLLPSR
ncbi:MAG TPA: peptidoglycan DD-metalloendopeptidase family protein [Arenimonas sp.]|nr:peptidoglycan DD-metalloendopeptidase family protein [Arenimonas sp.]